MKNTMQKGLSILLVLLMFAALMMPVAAAEGYTLTINNAKGGHTYEAYQIFTGTYSKADGATEGNLSNVEWGEGVDSTALLAALKAIDAYKDCTDAQDVADVLDGFADNADGLDAFAEVVNKHLVAEKAKDEFVQAGTAGAYTYTLQGLDDGYYLVKDADGSVSANDAYTKLILKMVGDVTVTAKADVPASPEKVIVGSEPVCGEEHEHTDSCKETKKNDAAIGDVINYKLTTQVPDMDGFETYTFKIVDTMSAGLTYNNDMVITINGQTLTKDTDYTITVNGQIITVEFIDFIDYNTEAYIGKDIVATYSAELNENAVVGDDGNTNEAHLVYSNDPQYEGTGSPDDEPPTGTTPDGPSSSTSTYTTGLKLIKFATIDGAKESLTGAEFKVEGTALNEVRVKKTENGATSSEIVPAANFNITAEVDENGYLQLEGLAAGTYTITEIKAPDGYNLLKAPITVVIDWNEDDGFAATADGEDLNLENEIFELEIENFSGPVLPETGGIGTHILYIVGGVLLTGAVVLLLVKVLTDRKQRAN